MKKRVLAVLTSVSELQPGMPTGVWLEELAALYFTLMDAGESVVLASPLGGAAPLDPMSKAHPWLTETGGRFLRSVKAMSSVLHTKLLAAIDPTTFDAVYFVGGAGVMLDFPDNPVIARLLESFDAAARPVTSVCHGGAALLNRANGRIFAAGRRMTVISDEEDRVAGLDALLPYTPEGRLRSIGADVSVAKPFVAHVVEDGHVITGQNPASAPLVARRLLELLRDPKPAVAATAHSAG